MRRESRSSARAWSRPTGTARRPTIAASCARSHARGHRHHLLRARRVRAAAASRHRRSAVGAGRGLSGDRRGGAVARARRGARAPTLIVKASGVGVFDALARSRPCSRLRPRHARDLLGRRRAGDARPRGAPIRDDPFRALIPRYDLVLTYGGGEPVRRAYRGARRARSACRSTTRSIPTTHYPVPPDPRFAARSRLSRQSPAGPRGARRGVLPRAGGAAARASASCSAAAAGATSRCRPTSATSVTSTRAITTRSTATPRAVLNVSRDSMARYGFSPATRVFEAAGAGACLITDAWEGIERFLEPGREILVARDGAEVAEHARRRSTPKRARGDRRGRAPPRAREHTYAQRAAQVEALLDGRPVPAWEPHAMKHRHSRPLDHLVLGQRPRDHLSRPGARRCAARGHEVLFLERDVPWYARQSRSARRRRTARTALYRSVRRAARPLRARGARRRPRDRRLVRARGHRRSATGCCATARGVTAFYDIDTPVTLAELERGARATTSRPTLIPRFDLYLSFTGGPTLRRLERELRRARGAAALLLGRSAAVLSRVDATALGSRLSRHLQRRPAAGARRAAARARARAGAERRFVVAGPQYPDAIEWPRQRRAHRASCRRASTAPFYAAQRFTLNVTRADMIARRLLAERAAVRGRRLRRADHQRLVAGSRNDLHARQRDPDRRVRRDTNHALSTISERERRAIGRRARRRVLADHTAEHRAIQLETYLAEAREALVRPTASRPCSSMATIPSA